MALLSFINPLLMSLLSVIFFVSYYVISLFTSIPLNETIELATDYILSNNPDVNISRKDLKKLFQFATAETHFYFNGEFMNKLMEDFRSRKQTLLVKRFTFVFVKGLTSASQTDNLQRLKMKSNIP